MSAQNNPIGIFDSGVGGLTVASSIKQILPDENIIYFGDTAHLPYGDKSSETIINYSAQIAGFLKEKQCKVIVIACNTASAVAFTHLKETVGSQIHLLNVIDPVVNYIYQHDYKNIGVIGTKGTINSMAYEKRIKALNDSVHVASMSTPLFVPMIEEGFIFDDISNAIIRSYLSRDELKSIDSLILGCTHYPIIKNQIRKFFDFRIDVLDSAMIVAENLKNMLTQNHLLTQNTDGKDVFYVSDYTDYFKNIARMFFEKNIDLQKVTLKD
jgi:glutamate racemase